MIQFGVDMYVRLIMVGNWYSFPGGYFIDCALTSSCIQNTMVCSFRFHNSSSFCDPDKFALSSVPRKVIQKFEKFSNSPSIWPSVSVVSRHNIFVGSRSPKKYNCLDPEYTKKDISYNTYKFFILISILGFEPQVDSLFASQWHSKHFSPEKSCQLENHTLLNSLYSSGDNSEDRIVKHISAVDNNMHRSNSM